MCFNLQGVIFEMRYGIELKKYGDWKSMIGNRDKKVCWFISVVYPWTIDWITQVCKENVE
jgi:hypothetical protein